MHRPVPRRRRRLGVRLVALLGLVLLLASCRADAVVDVVVDDDGAGVVTAVVRLDPEASQRLLDLDVGLPVDDLVRAGWEVQPPREAQDGSTVLEASKAFGAPEQFATVLDELDGPEGVFRSFRLERTKTFARVDHRLSGQLDPTGGLAQFADPELQALLGTPIEQLAEEGGLSPSDVQVRLRVDLPGDLREDSLTGTPVPDGDASWTLTLADPAPVVVNAATTSRLVAPLVLRGVAVVAAVLAGLVLLGQGLRLLRPESRRRPLPPARRALPPATGGGASPPGALPPEGGPPKVVALDAMGVLYREGDDVRRLLIPFARERGSLLTDEELVERARSLSLGRTTPAEFWSQVGAIGEPTVLDQEYLALHQLNPGVVKFLRAVRQRHIRAACVTNDAASWANALRRRHSLEGLVDLWVVSGSVGVRKPDPPIFEALRRLAQVPAADILLIDDDRVNLDAARELGFRTAWYCPEGPSGDSGGHRVLRSFEVAIEDLGPVPQEGSVQG